MPMNPLDWTAGPFLAFYFVLAALVFMCVLEIRDRIGPDETMNVTLDPIEMAYLTGGASRVGDAVLVGLLTANAVALSADAKTVQAVAPNAVLPATLEGFRYLLGTPSLPRRAFYSEMKTGLAALTGKLQRSSLSPNEKQVTQYLRVVTIAGAIPLMFGAAKIVVGVSRDKPVGFLVFFMAVTAFMVIRFLTPPRATRAGAKALEASKRDNARAARAPLENELMLAVALTGLVALSGTAYASIYKDSLAGGGTGCGGGDGGGGGGGCGGCGGGD